MVINSVTVNKNSIVTNITYTLNDGSTATVNVTTTNPQSQVDVINDLNNMAIEQEKEHDASVGAIQTQLNTIVGQPVQVTPVNGVLTLAPLVIQPAQPSQSLTP